MPRGGAKPGERRGGRQRGTPNKATAPLKELAGRYDAEAVEVLVGIMRNKELPAQARVGAVRELWDRAHGRPQQAVALGADGPLSKLLIGWIGDFNDSHL